MNIKKGDKVKILSGKDRGKTGKVLKSYPKESRLVVEGVNMVKKHRKSNQRGQKGERISFEAPLNISNVQLICNACGKPSRIGKKEVEGKRVRICKKCQAEV